MARDGDEYWTAELADEGDRRHHACGEPSPLLEVLASLDDVPAWRSVLVIGWGSG